MIRNTSIVKKISYFRIFLGTGQEHISFLKYPILLAIFIKQWYPNLSVLQLVLLVITSVAVLTFNGWFDLKYIKIPQTTAEIQTREYNPYFQNLENNVVPKRRKI